MWPGVTHRRAGSLRRGQLAMQTPGPSPATCGPHSGPSPMFSTVWVKVKTQCHCAVWPGPDCWTRPQDGLQESPAMNARGPLRPANAASRPVQTLAHRHERSRLQRLAGGDRTTRSGAAGTVCQPTETATHIGGYLEWFVNRAWSGALFAALTCRRRSRERGRDRVIVTRRTGPCRAGFVAGRAGGRSGRGGCGSRPADG